MAADVNAAFLKRLLEDLPRVLAESDSLALAPEPRSGDPPSYYHGLFKSVERLVPGPDQTFQVRGGPLPFALDFPADYCTSCDGTLQLRVARVLAPLAHPNVSPGGIVCLGPTFRPSTRLAPLLEHVHRICSGRIFAAESPWNARTADFYRRHPERIRALRAAPLWRRATAQRVRVENLESSPGGSR